MPYIIGYVGSLKKYKTLRQAERAAEKLAEENFEVGRSGGRLNIMHVRNISYVDPVEPNPDDGDGGEEIKEVVNG